MLQPRRQLDLPAKALDVEAGAQLGRQNFDDDVPVERDFADDEDARHAAAEVVGNFIAVAERALKTLGEIVHPFFDQTSSSLSFRAKDTDDGLCSLPALASSPLPVFPVPSPAFCLHSPSIVPNFVV